MKLKTKIILAALLAGLVLVALYAYNLGQKSVPPRQGSVSVGNDYYSTSTRNLNGTALASPTVLKNGPGTVARVTVTGANTGIIRLWDATTTDVTKRASNLASTSINMIEVSASAQANPYDFDATFNYGIVYEVVSGLTPTSTISWR